MKRSYINKTVVSVLSLLMIMEPCFAAVPVEAYKSYVKGLLESRAGNASAALSEYLRAAELDKNAVYVYKEIALLLWQAGNSDEALKAAAKLEQFYGDNLDVILFLGSFYLLAGESEKAKACWEKVLALDPENEMAVLYLAAFHMSNDEPEKAISYWNKFLDKEPDSAQAYYQLGLSQEKVNLLEKAGESYKRSMSIRPEVPETHLSMAQLYEKQEKYLAATQEYEKYTELVPDNLTVMLYLGGLYFRLKNHEAAEVVFSRAYKLNPSDITVCFWLGVLSEENKDWDGAIKYFNVIAAKEPSSSVFIRLSYYYSAKKDYKAALACLNRSVKLDPDNAVIYYMLGLAYMDLKKLGRAQDCFEKALALKPGLEGVAFHLGMVYDLKGSFEKAVQELNSELKENSNYAPALNYLGYSYADKGMKLDEAERLVKRALELDPENASYIDSMGWVYFKKGDDAKAEQFLMSASEKMKDPVIFEHLGDLYAKQSKTLDAWGCYRKALDLDPKNSKISKKIKGMEKLVLPNTLQRKALKRAVGNLRQMSSLKAGFSANGSSGGVNFRFAGFFQYQRPETWRVDVLGNFMAPQIVIIRNKGLKIYPEALEANFQLKKTEFFDKLESFLDSSVIDEFDSDKTVSERRGRKYHYSLAGRELIINSENGTVTELKTGDGVVFKFRDYSLEEGLYVPVDIEVYSEGDKVNAEIRFKNCIINKPIDGSEFNQPKNSSPM